MTAPFLYTNETPDNIVRHRRLQIKNESSGANTYTFSGRNKL